MPCSPVSVTKASVPLGEDKLVHTKPSIHALNRKLIGWRASEQLTGSPRIQKNASQAPNTEQPGIKLEIQIPPVRTRQGQLSSIAHPCLTLMLKCYPCIHWAVLPRMHSGHIYILAAGDASGVLPITNSDKIKRTLGPESTTRLRAFVSIQRINWLVFKTFLGETNILEVLGLCLKLVLYFREQSKARNHFHLLDNIATGLRTDHFTGKASQYARCFLLWIKM